MNKKQIRNKKWIWLGKFFLVGTMVFYSRSLQADFDPEWYFGDEAEFEIIETDKIWTKAENKVVEKGILIRNNATLTVEKGATIKFKREIEDVAPMIIVENGRIVADGTEKDPIFFTSDQNDSGFSFYFNNSHGQESFFRYVTIEKAGGKYERIYDDGAVQASWWQKLIVSRVLAEEITYQENAYPVHYYQGKVRFENCVFDNPGSEIEIKMENLMLTEENIENNSFQVVNSNFKAIRNQLVLASDMDCEYTGDWDFLDVCWNRTLFKNNWYGHSQGLVENYDSYFQRYLNVEGLREGDPLCEEDCFNRDKSLVGLFVNVDGYREKSLIVDPVIIIPGITGSEIDPRTGQWVLDPILHTYADLWESLKTADFEEGKNLFAFPYQWRQKNEISAKELKEKIVEVKNLTSARKVDLVAHSMGGLLARYYIESDGSDEQGLVYENDVDQLITLGTPHRGAPSAYLQWEAGEGYFGLLDQLKKYHFSNEAKHNGYNNIFSYIRAKVPSVKELLPDNRDYFSGVNGFVPGYPENSFLQELNEEEKWETLVEKVRLFKIAGYKESADDTLAELKLTASSQAGFWPDGMPENFYSNRSGLVYGAGDETVPLSSARGLNGGEGLTINATHRELPKEAQCEVLWKLGGKVCVKKDLWDFPNLLYFNVFSPVDIQVVAPDGKRVGKNFQTGELLNEIEGAFYSGFETENEFISLPVLGEDEGEYQLLIQGVGEETADRSYTIETSLLNDQGEEKLLTFSDEALVGAETQTILMVKDGELSKKSEISAKTIEDYFWEKWNQRILKKKEFYLFKNDLRKLVRWENIKNNAIQKAKNCRINKAYCVWIRKKGFQLQLQAVQKKLRKNKKNLNPIIWEELTKQLSELEKAQEK